ncbi:hypothetical protein PtB15_7B577 [Puccinia triticina]|nr:hypothetical protein PtB15_7B577 [Puccinia triticina]
MADRRKELHSIDHPTTRPAPGKWLRSGYAVPHGADGCTRAFGKFTSRQLHEVPMAASRGPLSTRPCL